MPSGSYAAGFCGGFLPSLVPSVTPPKRSAVLAVLRLERPVHFARMNAPMPDREPVDPTQVRTVPDHFAWVDHRFRDILHRLSLEEIALLFFLHLAADRNGCSFWADSTIARRIGLTEGTVVQARQGLLLKRLIAYRFPLYQVLPFVDIRR
jgi:hypothetical protein